MEPQGTLKREREMLLNHMIFFKFKSSHIRATNVDLYIWLRVRHLVGEPVFNSPGGRFSKDPVTYRARKAILETMIRLP